ncbi:acetoacetate--CoA ligase [Burkholderia multivorans]|uniref:acetoacetate--CoA ligase n=1 Tax=Burkholderia multivorans TaxID=87883 RepID=UPI0004F7C351|nr:acetoacetate--CoA ligase [Burkholderia multivorans]AIO74035.1 acetoacetate-CoA ligase [Burkholderia multivorans]
MATPTDGAGSVREGELLWEPSAAVIDSAQLTRFERWLQEHRGLSFASYDALRRWSVTDLEAFWSAVWDYYEVISDTPYDTVLDSRDMPGALWFSGSRVNFAEHVLRYEGMANAERIAIHHRSEGRAPGHLTWRQLGAQVRRLATRLRAMGIGPGDRVVSYMPAIPETAIAMLATIAIGAVWSSAAPEFGAKTVIERFSQIKPRLLFAADGYHFAGKRFDRVDEVRAIAAALPSVKQVIWLRNVDMDAALPDLPRVCAWDDALSGDDVPRETFRFERVRSDHPLWVVFSSGTTGLPKAIVHGHQGALLEYLKMMHLHMNLSPESVMFFYTTTGWIMWNVLLSSLLTGASIVLYDGSPVHPKTDVLWDIAAQTGVTCFGASPSYVQMMEKDGVIPKERHDLSRLQAVSVSGAPATPETYEWCYRAIKRDLWVLSLSGGTEACGAFVGGVPTLPVYAGEIQARSLGMDVQVWSDDGRDQDLADEVGELVVASPFPSMPLEFWGDDDGVRYRDAYFSVFPGVWRHGDYIKINARGGCFIYGRSDSTLNRHGVRIGTAEIYRAVEQVDGVADSLIVCCEQSDGSFYMPLFVQLKPGFEMDDDMRKSIVAKLRTDCSPRHVPDQILQVPGVPYTLTGKKTEVPVRKLLTGASLEKVVSRDALKNPSAIDWYVDFAKTLNAA